jgi:hypothetical protein
VALGAGVGQRHEVQIQGMHNAVERKEGQPRGIGGRGGQDHEGSGDAAKADPQRAFVEIAKDHRGPHRVALKGSADGVELAATGGTKKAEVHRDDPQGHRRVKVDDHRTAWLVSRKVQVVDACQMNARSRQQRIAVPAEAYGIAANGQGHQPRHRSDPVARQGRRAVAEAEVGFLQRHDISAKCGNPGQDPFGIAAQVGAKALPDVPGGDTQGGLGLRGHGPNIGAEELDREGRVPATSAIVLNGIRLLLAVEALVAAVRGVWPAVFITLAGLVLTVLPGRLANRVGLRLPPSFLAAIALFVLATLYLGEVRDFYGRFWWWDLALHMGSAMGFGILGFLLVFMLFQGDRYAAPPWALGALSFCLAMTVGVLWEIFEFAMDMLFGFNMMKSGLPDTMVDLIVDAVGAALAAFAGVVYLLDRAGRLGAPFDQFIDTNRARFRKIFARKRRG